MYREVHANRVLYKAGTAHAGHRYRQIAVVEKEQFEVRIFEGDVVQTAPEFIAESSGAEVHLHDTLKETLARAEAEFQSSVAEGWAPVSATTY
jgi:hypothetical protein